MRPKPLARAVTAEASVQGRAWRAELEILRRLAGDRTLVIGPWTAELGQEILFWLPLLRHLVATGRLEPARAVAVTRGGAGVWYGDVAARALDLFELLSPDELRRGQERRLAETGALKQLSLHHIDRTAMSRVREHLGEPVTFLHPSLMFNLFQAYWTRRRTIGWLERRTSFAPLPSPPVPAAAREAIERLPAEYVAVKAYFSECLPGTDGNRAWVARTIATLAGRVLVVALSTAIDVDDHEDFRQADGPRVITLEHAMRPEDNLAVQTRVVAGASALLATYGGFSYMGPFLGTSTYAFFSRENFDPTQLDAMTRATRALARAGGDAGYVVSHVREAQVLQALIGARG